MDGIPLRQINFSVDIFIDKMEKQSCRMPIILEGNIASDSQGHGFKAELLVS